MVIHKFLVFSTSFKGVFVEVRFRREREGNMEVLMISNGDQVSLSKKLVPSNDSTSSK